MAYLVLMRHATSEWNARGVWTGRTDIPLSEKGREEAKNAAAHLREIPTDIAYTSLLSRASETLHIVLSELGRTIPVVQNAALNERDYGAYTGKNKWDVKAEIGDAEFQKLRRSWDHPVPKGETLKDVYARVAPYFDTVILKDIQAGKNVLIVAHGNSLRALEKHIEDLSEEAVLELEIGVAGMHVYLFDKDAKMTSKEYRGEHVSP